MKISYLLVNLFDYTEDEDSIIYERISEIIWTSFKIVDEKKGSETLKEFIDFLKLKLKKDGNKLILLKNSKVQQSIMVLINKILNTNLSYHCVVVIEFLTFMLQKVSEDFIKD